jgi:hypothetical protein
MMVNFNKQVSSTVHVDGYTVPYIEAHVFEGENEGLISLILDNRFGLDTNAEEIERWLPFLANAMAVAAGRTSHGEHSNIRNPHGENLAGYPTEHIVGKMVGELVPDVSGYPDAD